LNAYRISAVASVRGLRTEIAFAVNANADRTCFHVALSNHKHGVDFHLFGALDFAAKV
jgi:hypothetical protein